MERKRKAKKLKRLSYKMKAKGCRTLDGLWNAAIGGRTEVPSHITDAWLKKQRKNAKEAIAKQKRLKGKTLFEAVEERQNH